MSSTQVEGGLGRQEVRRTATSLPRRRHTGLPPAPYCRSGRHHGATGGGISPRHRRRFPDAHSLELPPTAWSGTGFFVSAHFRRGASKSAGGRCQRRCGSCKLQATWWQSQSWRRYLSAGGGCGGGGGALSGKERGGRDDSMAARRVGVVGAGAATPSPATTAGVVGTLGAPEALVRR